MTRNKQSKSDLTYKGQDIDSRPSDGYVNGTQMAKANRVTVKDWLRLDETKAYIIAVAEDLGIKLQGSNKSPEPAQDAITQICPMADSNDSSDYMPLVEKRRDKTGTPSTWLHPLLALNFGRWISPHFAVWCDKHIKVLLETGSTTISFKSSVKATLEQLEAAHPQRAKRYHNQGRKNSFIKQRLGGIDPRKEFVSECTERGVKSSSQHAKLAETININITGMDSKSINALRNQSGTTRDKLSEAELNMMQLAESESTKDMRRKGLKTFGEIHGTVSDITSILGDALARLQEHIDR